MMPRPASVSVIDPIQSAIEWVKTLLFRPFDLAKWMTIGFCAWLAMLGEAGYSANFNSPSHGQSVDLHREFEKARTYMLDNLHWIIPLAVALFIVAFVVGTVILWLNSRGKFMFLHCVVLDVAEVVTPWNKFKTQGNSLFWFRFGLQVIGMILTLPMVVLGATALYRMALVWRFIAADIGLLIVLGMVLLLLSCVFLVIQKLTCDFVVPIMFLRGGQCLAAWREFLSLLSANAGRFVLYFLFQILMQIVIGLTLLVLLLVTCCLCCVGCCLLMIPYIGTVVLLPVLVFERAYSLYYFRQYGDDFDVFRPGVAKAVMPPAPAVNGWNNQVRGDASFIAAPASGDRPTSDTGLP
jgi:hypothetical protein